MSALFFEDCQEGSLLRHSLSRTVTETDNLLFSSLTLNPQPLHLDEEYSKQTIYGRRIVNSIFTLGLVCGISVADTTSGTTLGNLGFQSISFPKPVLLGDTLHAETEILSKRESRSRSDAGIVHYEHRGFNQRGELICTCRRAALILRKDVVAGGRS